MNPLALTVLLVTALTLLLGPRRWAPVALLIGTCYVTRAQELELGPFHFTIVRMLLVVGVLRVLMRSEWIKGGLHALDWAMLPWAGLMLVTVAFHKNPGGQIIERLGFVFDAFGAYFLIRCFCQTWEDTYWLCRVTGTILAPIAVSMLVEKVTTHNFFAFLGGVPEISHIREGHLRAQGPFGHAILAGTVGAVCLPLALSVWRRHRSAALIGAASCLSMVIASGSSGPMLSVVAAVGALAMWRYRASMRAIRWYAVLAYVALDVVMKDPAYFVMARIDLTGGSTGWFRARLIQSSIEHLSEWWLAGTDYTRHWMPTGVTWSPDHTDVTDHYVYMGVVGGLPLMAAFIAILVNGFVIVGRRLRDSPKDKQFAVWALGSSLFCHAVTIISVSYFDSSIVFFYLSLGLIGSAPSEAVATAAVTARKALPQNLLRRKPNGFVSRPATRIPERAASLRVHRDRGPGQPGECGGVLVE